MCSQCVPTHSLYEDFTNAYATADLPQALFHRLRIHVMSNGVGWDDEKMHLSRTQNGYAADLSLKSNTFIRGPLHAVSTDHQKPGGLL